MKEIFASGEYAMWALFAFVGGAISYLLRSQTVNLRGLMIESVGAAFVGAVVAMGCAAYGLSTPLTGALVGISALVGARASINGIELLVKRRLHIETPNEPG